jgi:hypothetical protein
MRTFIGAVKSRIAKGKIPVKKVKITSAEGITTVVNKLKKRNFRTLESASEALKVLVPTDGGYYNKVNFKVFFDDGYTYEGKAYVSKSEYRGGKNFLRNHINSFINNVLKEKTGFWVKYQPELRRFKKKYAL